MCTCIKCIFSKIKIFSSWAFLIVRRLFVCKIFAFLSSLTEPMGQFQPNLAHRVFLNKGPWPLSKKRLRYSENTSTKFEEPLGQYQSNLASLGEGYSIFSNGKPFPLPRRYNNEIAKNTQTKFINTFSPETLCQFQPNLAQNIVGCRLRN